MRFIECSLFFFQLIQATFSCPPAAVNRHNLQEKSTSRLMKETESYRLHLLKEIQGEISSTTMMKPAKKSDDDSLLQYLNKIMKSTALRKSKYWQFPTSQQPLLHSFIYGSVKRTQIASFTLGFKSLKFLHESIHDKVSGTDNDEHVKQLSSVFHLWLLEVFS